MLNWLRDRNAVDGKRKGHLCLLCWLWGRDQSGKRHAGLVGRVAGLWLALFAVTAVVPAVTVFLPSNFDARAANWCEILSARHAGKGGVLSRGEIAQFQKTQPLLLQQQFAGLTPSRKGETNDDGSPRPLSRRARAGARNH